MPTTDQKADLLFKKYLGKGSSGTSSLYFNEPLDGRTTIFPLQIWQEQGLIPVTAGAVSGITQQVTDLVLTQVPGQPFAFYDAQLKDAIPFNYDFNGSYVPTLKTNAGATIPFGLNDWIVDIETGMVTFYAGLPAGVSLALPPKITFWKYIGSKGFATASATASWSETASWAISASYAITSSYTLFSEQASASYSSIYSINALNATNAQQSVSASHAELSDNATTASLALQSKTASFIGSNSGPGGIAGGTASYSMRSGTSIVSDTASYAYFAQVTLGTASYALWAVSASHAVEADHAAQASTASLADYATNAGLAENSTTASYALYAEIALGTASYSLTGKHSDTASYLDMAGGTASHAALSDQAVSASHAERAEYTYGTSSYADKATFAFDAETASYAHFAQVALGTASYALSAGTASLAEVSLWANDAAHSWTASYVNLAQNARTASYVPQAITASYAHFAQVALGTASYANDADHAWTASYAWKAEESDNATQSLYATHSISSSYAQNSSTANTASFVALAKSASWAETASYAFYAIETAGTSSYAINAATASKVVLADTASVALYAKTASYAFFAVDARSSSYSAYAEETNHAASSNYSIQSAEAASAGWAVYASSSQSSSYSETASYSETSSISSYSVTSSYALTASYFDGTASGSVINIGLPTDGYYGSGSDGNIAGIAQGDKMEDALDKLDMILDKLVPAKPPALSTKAITLSSPYSARKAGTNMTYTNITDDTTPSFTMVGGAIAANAFADGNNGTLSALIDGVSVGSRALTPSDDTGTYGALQITADADYYVGQSGKAGFWYALLAQVNAQSVIDDDLPHTASLSHTLTGTSSPAFFYIDNPVIPGPFFGTAVASGLTYVSGVPAYVGGTSASAVSFSATASFGASWRFYNSTRVYGASGTGISATNCPLPSSPSAGSLISGSWSATIIGGSTSENASYTLTAYNSKGGTATLNITNTFYRLDSTLDSANRATSGVGQFPIVGYGQLFNPSTDLSSASNEELQMLNGQYRYPTGNYTSALPVAGPNYTSVPTGSYNNYRWVTFALGSVSAASNLTFTFTNSSNFSGGGTAMSNFMLQARVNGSTPTAGWVDGNLAYPGVGNPTNNGDAALVVANSTSTVKVVTFGTATKTGTVFLRIGIPNGDNKRFTNVTMTFA